MDISVKLTQRKPQSAIASVRVDFPEGGFSIHNIYVRNVDGKPRYTLPLNDKNHPMVVLRGDLKQKIFAAIWDCFCVAPTGA